MIIRELDRQRIITYSILKSLEIVMFIIKVSRYAFIFLLGLTTISYSHEVNFKHILIKHPIIPFFNGGMKTAAGYMTIINTSDSPDKITAVKTKFANAMIHKTTIDSNGVARMEHIEEILIPSQSSIKFENGGLHIMFTNLKEALEPLVDQEVTIFFEKAGQFKLQFMVEKVTGQSKMKTEHKKDH